jgi:carbon monoxide dehydrogenase subunit G
VRTTFPIEARAEAWSRLADPEVLAAILPGCRSVTAVASTGGLQLVVDLSVASVRGLWAGTVERVGDSAVRIAGSGEPGTVDLVVRADASRSSLAVEGTVDGPLATVGSAVLAAAVRRMAADVLGAAGTPASVPPRGDGFQVGEPEAMGRVSGTHDLGRPATELIASHGSTEPDGRAASAGRRRAVARVAAAAGVVAVVIGRRHRSRRRSG